MVGHAEYGLFCRGIFLYVNYLIHNWQMGEDLWEEYGCFIQFGYRIWIGRMRTITYSSKGKNPQLGCWQAARGFQLYFKKIKNKCLHLGLPCRGPLSQPRQSSALRQTVFPPAFVSAAPQPPSSTSMCIFSAPHQLCAISSVTSISTPLFLCMLGFWKSAFSHFKSYVLVI